MKILVVGNGGREHALAWSLLRSAAVQQVFCVPGNGGTARLERCQNVPFPVSDFARIVAFAQKEAVDLVVVGPEAPLADGITNSLLAAGIKVFGPTQDGAQIEASKSWAKSLMHEARIPTARAASFDNAPEALAYLAIQPLPIVIKADGLAAGKGVTVAQTQQEAEEAVEAAFGGQFGTAGQRVLIEEFMTGQEVSVLAITDGLTVRPLVPAQDHKQVGEGDQGPNTGGMGAYAPTPILNEAAIARVMAEILEPAVACLRDRGIDYRGVLYAGLMITPNGDPKVVEFNCRFGDPETQVVLPLLDTPLEEVLLACADQRLAEFPDLQWKRAAAACVVLAAGGYPGSYRKGDVIQGLEAAEATGALVFHAGTRQVGDDVVTDGGRVLGVTATGDTFERAIANAYAAIPHLHFEGMYYRRDIGHRILGDRPSA